MTGEKDSVQEFAERVAEEISRSRRHAGSWFNANKQIAGLIASELRAGGWQHVVRFVEPTEDDFRWAKDEIVKARKDEIMKARLNK